MCNTDYILNWSYLKLINWLLIVNKIRLLKYCFVTISLRRHSYNVHAGKKGTAINNIHFSPEKLY